MKKIKIQILTIGDIHGFSTWKVQLSDIEAGVYDKVIFIGDYVDSFTVSDRQITKNLQEIIELKKKYPNMIVLLWGNHDVQYYKKMYFCSGFRESMYNILHKIFKSNENLFVPFHFEGNWLFTHAGVTKTWLDHQCAIRNMSKTLTLAEKLDTIWKNPQMEYDMYSRRMIHEGYHSADSEVGGPAKYSSPLWVRPEALVWDAIDEYNQVVGHTGSAKPYSKTTNENCTIWFIDTISYPGNYEWRKKSTDEEIKSTLFLTLEV